MLVDELTIRSPTLFFACCHPPASLLTSSFLKDLRENGSRQFVKVLTRRHCCLVKVIGNSFKTKKKQEETRIIFYLTCMSRLLAPCQPARTIKLKNTISQHVSRTKIMDIPCFQIKSMEAIKLQIIFSYNYITLDKVH